MVAGMKHEVAPAYAHAICWHGPHKGCFSAGGSKVTVQPRAIMVRVPAVLLGAVERIAEAEGWANRQAVMEQALREKVERWEREHPLGVKRSP